MKRLRLVPLLFLLASLSTACNQTATTETAATTTAAADTAALAKKPGWWKETVVYQLYPRSFKDSDGDCEGDLRGIISRLDYLKSLGVGTVWLNPIYASPNDDSGYDISDYHQIQLAFGAMADRETHLGPVRRPGPGRRALAQQLPDL